MNNFEPFDKIEGGACNNKNNKLCVHSIKFLKKNTTKK